MRSLIVVLTFLVALSVSYGFRQPVRAVIRPLNWHLGLPASSSDVDSDVDPLYSVSQFMGKLFSKETNEISKKARADSDPQSAVPAWKLLEDSMKQSGEDEGLDTKTDDNGVEHEFGDYDSDNMSAEGFEFDDIPRKRDSKGRFVRVRQGIGRVSGGVLNIGRRLLPWSERNKEVRQRKREKNFAEQTLLLDQEGRGPGVLGRVALTFRRRLLNLFDRGDDAQNWAKIMDKATVADAASMNGDFELLQKQFSYSNKPSDLVSEDTGARNIVSFDSGRTKASDDPSNPLSFVRNNVLGVLYWHA